MKPAYTQAYFDAFVLVSQFGMRKLSLRDDNSLPWVYNVAVAVIDHWSGVNSEIANPAYEIKNLACKLDIDYQMLHDKKVFDRMALTYKKCCNDIYEIIKNKIKK